MHLCRYKTKSIKKQSYKKTIGYIRIIGGNDFINQNFNFTGYNNLKELYLVEILDSKVRLEDCENLEVFATSQFIYKPKKVIGPSQTTVSGNSGDNSYQIDGPIAEWPIEGIPLAQWPQCAEPNYLLSDLNGQGLTIINCSNIREISLENTRINAIDFSGLSRL